MISENGFKTVLATSCCCEHGAKVSEAVPKIATDQKILSQMLLVRYSVLNSQNISISNDKKGLAIRTPPT